jgi:DNA-binding GntR family transcriptional regulator
LTRIGSGGAAPDRNEIRAALRMSRPRAAIAERLESAPGAGAAYLERLTRLPDRRPVDAEMVHIRADRLALHATLQRGAVRSQP